QVYELDAAAISAPTAQTNAATSVQATTARVNGQVSDDGGEACEYRFRYKKSGGAYSYTTWTGAKTTGQTFYEDLSGLDKKSLYYFNAQAKNSAGESAWGGELSFTTLATIPVVSTQTTDSVDCEAATSHGTITDTGGENCDFRGFVWDTASHGDPGNTTPASTAYGSNWTESGSFGAVAFSHGISGLPSGQIYYIRACAHNSAGWSYGGEVNFTTVGESSYNTMVGSPTSWTWQKADYEAAEKCPIGSPTSWAWEAPTCKGADKTPQGSPTSFNWGSE
ncbi:unnamed protein product, partial [marine sediment metagenome]